MFNFDVFTNGLRIRSFDSLRQAKKFASTLVLTRGHVFIRDNKNASNSRFHSFSLL